MRKFVMVFGLAVTTAGFGATAQAADVARGEQLSKARCAACHTFDNGGANRVGPNLWGIVSEGPGSAEGFNYSADYRAAVETGFEWTDKNLHAYLEDPTVFLRDVTGKGNARSRMTFKMPNEAERDDVIAYLKTLQ